MSLTERLAQASRQRRIDDGEEEEAAAPPATIDLPAPDPPVLDADHETFTGIEYQPIPNLRLVHGGRPPIIVPSAATNSGNDPAEADGDVAVLPTAEHLPRCPSCGALAHIDMVDLVGHTTHYSCERCETLWYASTAARPPATESVTPLT